MEIQPIVVGTAGHIDHGKSSLVKALTGIDPDRLKEEQERGMTIDLGFARFALPDGRQVGIVDVPGHERFIKNMVAGATGIDLVILVVAADDGVMPQTREHLSIMGLLGVQRGLIALTKIDAVEPDLVALAADDVRSTVRGTFLEDAPILPVSSVTREGLAELAAELARMAAATPPRSSAGVFRMPIQRVFSAHGFGTVVTGIPVSGSVSVGDVLEIVPPGLVGKVRGLQAYHAATTTARAGHSTAINLADIEHHQVTRGHVVAARGFFKPVSMVAGRLSALPLLDRPIKNRTRIRLHTGTAEVLGEVVLLDCAELVPGGEALVQLRLDEPVVCAAGDRFVVRAASPVETLGGGIILEESKHRLKRFKGFVVDELSRQAATLASPRDLLDTILFRAGNVLSTSDALAVEVKRPRGETETLLHDLASQQRVIAVSSGSRWAHAERIASGVERATGEMKRWFDEHAERERMDVRDLRAAVQFDPDFLKAVLEEAERRGSIQVEPGGMLRLARRRIELDPAASAIAGAIVERHRVAAFQPPSPAELAIELGIGEPRVRGLLQLLTDRGELHAVSREFFLTADRHAEARAAIVANCQRTGSLDIPSLRDALSTSRKFLIPLLEHFDSQGLTLRQGANRVLKRR